MPEGRIPLAQATIYVATAPKSNSAIMSIYSIMSDISLSGGGLPVPDHLKDSHYHDASKYGFVEAIDTLMIFLNTM